MSRFSRASDTTTPPTTAPAKRGKGMMIGIAVVVIIVIVVAALYLTGYLGGGGGGTTVNIVDNTSCTPTGTSACAFQPSTVSIAHGNTVTWKNTGQADHTVHFFSGNSTATGLPGNSTTISAGTSYTATFSSAGTYYYFCSIHSWMHGTVTST